MNPNPTTYTLDGKKYEAVEGKCEDCAFHTLTDDCSEERACCCFNGRTDDLEIFWQEVKPPKKSKR